MQGLFGAIWASRAWPARSWRLDRAVASWRWVFYIKRATRPGLRRAAGSLHKET